MKKILIIHLNQENETETARFLDHDLEILHSGCGGEPDKARELIREYDGQVDAIGLEGLPALLELGPARNMKKAAPCPMLPRRHPSWTAVASAPAWNGGASSSPIVPNQVSSARSES
jgi:hypothetical protein